MSMSSRKSSCTSGCRTKDHASYSECLQSKTLHVAYSNEGGRAGDYTTQKKWDAELDSYRAAVRQGMQPESTRTKDINAAVQWSDKHGRAYSEEAALDTKFNNALERQ